ncbi:MAG: hypothetical protein ISR75_06955 [Phycisphaerales bacterium]|nr:hypothetical protein [Phycisphaerales bacterium]
MSDQPQTNTTDLPPIDTSKIEVVISELEAPDFQFDFTVPVDLISEITKRIQDGGLEYNEQQIANLLIQICLDEGMQRLDRDSAWGARLLTKSVKEYLAQSPFSFSAVVDALPEEEIPIESIPIKRNQIQVDDVLVDTELFEQQLQFGTTAPFDGDLAYGDAIECNASLHLDGDASPIAEVEKCTIRVPSEHQNFSFEGLTLDTVGNELRGCHTEKELSFKIDFPDGKAGTLKLRDCSFSRITPSSVAHVLEQYGSPNEAILRTQIKMSLQHNFDRENTNFMMQQFYAFLVENIQMPFSNRVIQKKYKEMCENTLKSSKEESLSDKLKHLLLQKAEATVKRQTINYWIRQTYKLGVSEEDIDKQAAIIAEQRRVRPADIKEEFLAKDKINVLANIASERKIFERLQDKMVFTDI